MSQECWNAISQIKTTQEELQGTIVQMQIGMKQVDSLVTDTNMLRQDVNNVQHLLQNLQLDVKSVKRDVLESHEVWTSLSELQGKALGIQSDLKVAHQELADLRSQLGRVIGPTAVPSPRPSTKSSWWLHRLGYPVGMKSLSEGDLRKASSEPSTGSLEDRQVSDPVPIRMAEGQQQKSGMMKHGEKIIEGTREHNAQGVDLHQWWEVHCTTEVPITHSGSMPPPDTSTRGPRASGKRHVDFDSTEHNQPEPSVDSGSSKQSVQSVLPFFKWRTKLRPQITKSKKTSDRQKNSGRTEDALVH